jgi:flagellar basal body-associated protein FliL
MSAPKKASSDRLVPVMVVAAILVLVGLPAAVATGASWVDWSDSTNKAEQAPPSWVTTEPVRAISGDGEVIKARVALDVPDAETRSLIQSQPQQVALLLQITVSEHERGRAEGAERVQRLAGEIETRLNEYLVANKVPPVREAVIQDLVISKP